VPLAVDAWNGKVASWDESVSQRIHAYENRETILNSRVDVLGAVLHPGVQVLGLFVVSAAAVALRARGDGRRAMLLLVAVIGAAAVGVILKGVFAQPALGPDDVRGSGFEFPSGHALRSMAAAAAFAVVAWPTRWRWLVLLAGIATVLVVGLAVVYHEWHLVSEVLGGWCIAVAWVAGTWLLVRPRARTDIVR
jgi:membrane-associated phospholipid phosphatase